MNPVAKNTSAKSHRWGEKILAVAALLLGGALAVVCLVFKPVVVIESNSPVQIQPHRDNAGDVYYVRGSREQAKWVSWIRKRAALLVAAPGVVTLNEDEINAWFAASTHTRPSQHGAQDSAQLDFRIADGMLQVAAPVTVETPLGNHTLLVQMRGVFNRLPDDSDGGLSGFVMYAPREAYVGALPLHRIPGATARLVEKLLDTQIPPGEALAVWRQIESVTISGRELRINISAGNE